MQSFSRPKTVFLWSFVAHIFTHVDLASVISTPSQRQCTQLGLTVCNNVPLTDCSLRHAKFDDIGQNSAVDVFSIMEATVLNQSDVSSRYVKLQWTKGQRGGTDGKVFVRLTPLVQGHQLASEVVCMSGSLRDTMATQWGRPLLSSLLSLETNMTSYKMDVVGHDKLTTYWIYIPRPTRTSRTLPAVSLTLLQNQALISLTPPDTHGHPGISYSYHLTLLVCSREEATTWPWNIVRSDSWGFGNCSNFVEERRLAYDKTPKGPIVINLTQHAYQLWLNVYDGEHSIGSLRTPTFFAAAPRPTVSGPVADHTSSDSSSSDSSYGINLKVAVSVAALAFICFLILTWRWLKARCDLKSGPLDTEMTSTEMSVLPSGQGRRLSSCVTDSLNDSQDEPHDHHPTCPSHRQPCLPGILTSCSSVNQTDAASLGTLEESEDSQCLTTPGMGYVPGRVAASDIVPPDIKGPLATWQSIEGECHRINEDYNRHNLPVNHTLIGTRAVSHEDDDAFDDIDDECRTISHESC